MTTSDEHLERSLEEYNGIIAKLENGDSKEELLDALTYRSTILMLLESFTSSITDAEEALELCDEIEAEGKKVDPGIKIKLHENRGQLCYDTDLNQMASDYREIVKLLGEFGESTKHYQYRETVVMCLDCASDLVDKEMHDAAMPFVQKAEKVISGKEDVWSKNRGVETYNLKGQIFKERKEYDEARGCFEESIAISNTLGHDLEDEMELAFSHINIGDMSQTKGDIDDMIVQHEKAISILTRMNDKGKLDDVKILVDLHQGVATELMDRGKVDQSEKHLMAAMKLGMPAINETMKNLGLKKE